MDVHCSALSRQTKMTPVHLLPPDQRSPPTSPAPSAEALQHSARLAALIGAEIAAAGGAIPFARNMDLALYAPGLGYYSAGAQKFGAAADRLPARYLILERSADLRARQQALLAERVPQYLERAQWLDRLPERRLRGVVFANELLDALPVHMFTLTEDGPQELYVAQSQDEFHWQPVPCGTLLQGRVDVMLLVVGELPLVYSSEI